MIHATPLPERPSGTPMSYSVGGKQYIVMAWSGSGKSGLMSLALP
jgi:glucose dehydrogenase